MTQRPVRPVPFGAFFVPVGGDYCLRSVYIGGIL